VRSLAQRSAEAAKETAHKISMSTEKSEQGVRISEKMAQNLAAILEKTRLLDERIAEIADSSTQQDEGIGQLNTAVASMDKVTQENAALAEESAAASEELRAQAEQVRIEVRALMRMARGDEAPEASSGPQEPEPETRAAPVRHAVARSRPKAPSAVAKHAPVADESEFFANSN
jgi:methyl-accepting chemotaxis protein